jgi:hypothetical protein
MRCFAVLRCPEFKIQLLVGSGVMGCYSHPGHLQSAPCPRPGPANLHTPEFGAGAFSFAGRHCFQSDRYRHTVCHGDAAATNDSTDTIRNRQGIRHSHRFDTDVQLKAPPAGT